MTEQMIAMTPDQAVAAKQARARELTTTTPVKTWQYSIQPTAADAAAFLNIPPAQAAGEAFASNRADGQVDLYYFI